MGLQPSASIDQIRLQTSLRLRLQYYGVLPSLTVHFLTISGQLLCDFILLQVGVFVSTRQLSNEIISVFTRILGVVVYRHPIIGIGRNSRSRDEKWGRLIEKWK